MEGLELAVEGDFSGWSLSFQCESPRTGVAVAAWDLEAPEDRSLPEMKIRFQVPQNDAQVKWYPLEDLVESHHYIPYWWHGGKIVSSLAHGAPIICYMNLAGENRLAYAVSECLREVRIQTGGKENGQIFCEVTLFAMPEAPRRHARVELRIDRRPVFYAQALREIGEWYAEMPAYTPAPVPAPAEEPLYSTWYQFQKDVTAAQLERELPLIAELGLGSIILDDGWQCLAPKPGEDMYFHAGNWNPVEAKFPDMAGHVAKFHAKNILYTVWIALPFIGAGETELYRKFQDKFLYGKDVGTLDPRYPEVREYLIADLERVVRTWNLDGLKLDFIDSFQIQGTDPAAARSYAGCDIPCLPEAVDRLLTDIQQRLSALKPGLMIEFRQHYTGPAMLKYGNMFRAADCAFDTLQNRVRTVDLRLTAGASAVHSDMIIWGPQEAPEVAVLQLLSVLFSVPQVSVMLSDLSPECWRMLKFWIGFWKQHKATLLHGDFLPEHPELSYPVVRARGVAEEIVAVYEADKVIRLAPDRTVYVVNATHADRLTVQTEARATVELRNVYGEETGTQTLEPGFHDLPAPQGGFATLRPIA